MTIPSAYLTSSKNTRAILESVQRAGVPTRFTYEFLKQLGYPSSTDRPMIAVLKGLGFLAESGEPTERYRRFKDSGLSKSVMAEAVRAAYADVFTVDQQANTKTTNELKGIFARLSDKGESVNEKMATTFKTLSEMADFKASPPVDANGSGAPAAKIAEAQHGAAAALQDSRGGSLRLHHDVHIHLPESTNIEVYNAIFRSLREHLG